MSDPEVMRSKIAFMANRVKPHPNIIQFIGSIAEDKNQGTVYGWSYNETVQTTARLNGGQK